jgi:hypothetical protein
MATSTEKALLLCAMLALAGCSTRVDEWELLSLAERCKDHGGITYIDTFLKTAARCRDGTFIFPKAAP